MAYFGQLHLRFLFKYFIENALKIMYACYTGVLNLRGH